MGYFFSSATIMIQAKNNQRIIIKTHKVRFYITFFFISHFYANIASFFLIFFLLLMTYRFEQ